MDVHELARLPAADLTDGICQTQALINALHRRQLALIAAYDTAEYWKDDGATSMPAWLVATLAHAHDTARQDVGLSRSLEELPAISQAYTDGALSRDQAVALSSFATPETDTDLASHAPRFSVGQLRRMSYRLKPVPAEHEAQAHRDRELVLRWDLRNKMLHLKGRLPAAEGAVVEKALERLVPAVVDALGYTTRDHARAQADALVHLASTNLATDGDADRATVAVHVDAAVLAGGSGMAELERAGAIALETARRLSCDSRWYIVANGAGGTPLGIGRTSRQIPPWLARQVRHRDDGCRWPGCERKGWTHVHHIEHWGKGGRTDYENLVTLCGEHHRMAHEGGWQISGDPDDELRFISPDGTRVLVQGPPRLRPEVRERVFGTTADGLSLVESDPMTEDVPPPNVPPPEAEP